MRFYTAVAERRDGWWAVRVPEAPGVFTQARRLDQVEAMTRDAIATMLDVPPESIYVDIEPVLAPPVQDALRWVTKARKEAEAANEALAESSKTAARALVDSGLTVRDAGRIMGLSYQRVGQLAHQDVEAG